MKIISWNILQGGGKRAQAIGDTIAHWNADIVVLQEFRHGNASLAILQALKELNLEYQFSNSQGSRNNCVLVASRKKIQCGPWADDLDTTSAVHVRTKYENLTVNLMVAHLPHKQAQVPYFEALLDNKSLLSSNSLIIGDLNCGIPFEDSDSKTFANTHLFQALLQQGWTDSWRSRHVGVREYTWISNKGNGYRYDHSFSSPKLDERLKSVKYDHQVRESGLSDHSTLILELK